MNLQKCIIKADETLWQWSWLLNTKTVSMFDLVSKTVSKKNIFQVILDRELRFHFLLILCSYLVPHSFSSLVTFSTGIKMFCIEFSLVLFEVIMFVYLYLNWVRSEVFFIVVAF